MLLVVYRWMVGWYIKKSFRYEEVSVRIVFYASGGVQVDGGVVNKKNRFVTEVSG